MSLDKCQYLVGTLYSVNIGINPVFFVRNRKGAEYADIAIPRELWMTIPLQPSNNEIIRTSKFCYITRVSYPNISGIIANITYIMPRVTHAHTNASRPLIYHESPSPYQHSKQ